MRPAKVPYLEGLRGIAAMQVVLLHFVTGFLPNTAQHSWPPLRVLFDGHTAVYVFFLISGAVLAPSFARSGAFLGKLAKRVVRSASRSPRRPSSPRCCWRPGRTRICMPRR